MATSTLVQFLNPGVSSDTMNRSQEETFLAGGIIALGDWVAFDLSKTGADKALYVVQAPNVAASGIITGVAVQAAAAGEQVRVCVDGYGPLRTSLPEPVPVPPFSAPVLLVALSRRRTLVTAPVPLRSRSRRSAALLSPLLLATPLRLWSRSSSNPPLPAPLRLIPSL